MTFQWQPRPSPHAPLPYKEKRSQSMSVSILALFGYILILWLSLLHTDTEGFKKAFYKKKRDCNLSFWYIQQKDFKIADGLVLWDG